MSRFTICCAAVVVGIAVLTIDCIPAMGEADEIPTGGNFSGDRGGFFGQIDPPKGAELTQMSYEFYPEALANVIRAVNREFKGDILVTENGIATADDSRRVEFIRRALAGVQSCIDEGLLPLEPSGQF